MKQAIRAIDQQNERTGTFNGFEFVGYEYEEGWFISIAPGDDQLPRLLWIDGTFAATRFSVVSPSSSNGAGQTEIDAEPIDVTTDAREAILGMIWEWEVWAPITVAGTCAIDSLCAC